MTDRTPDFRSVVRSLAWAVSFSSAIAGPSVLPSNAADRLEPHRVYLANDDHTDYLWTADADTYAHVFVDLLDFHLHLADLTAGNPSPYRARFNTDGNFWLWNYERTKTSAEFDRLMSRVKDGTIGSPLTTLVSCYGAQPVEAAIRGMYYAGRLERRYDLRFPLANATENQTLPLGLASLFAGAGADYTWRGVCACATRLEKSDLRERPHEIYWYTGHDRQRLLMKWYSAGPHNIGTYLEADNPASSIRYLETDPGFLHGYVDPATQRPYDILGIFGFGGDDLERKTGVPPPPEIPGVPGLQKVRSSPYTDHFHVIAEQLTTPKRQVIVSNEADFFTDFSAHYGATLPSESVTHGNEWDLYSASMSETSARVKRAVEQLRAAELLATLVSLHYPRFMDNHVGARDEAFTDLGLYWEHDWTADGPVSRGQRAAWQEKIAATIEYYVRSIYAEGLIRLGGMVPRPEKSNRFFVLNPLSWTRTEAADFEYAGPANVHVRDVSTGHDVPHQLVKIDGATRLRILAPAVPPTGYKVFEILPGPGTAPTDPAAKISGDNQDVMENSRVKIQLDRDGAIRSFIALGAEASELVREIDGLKLNDFAANTDAGEPLQIENVGPVSVTLRARSDSGVSHISAVTLYRDSDRVDLRNDITANFSDVRYWSFGFNFVAPVIHTEEVGAILLDRRQADGGDYADSHARYDHVTVNHFADITAGDGERGVTLSNPDLAFAKLGRSTTKFFDTATPQINLLAGGQVDGRYLGIQNQNGETHFLQRFALRAHRRYDPAAAMRFAVEHQNPLVTGALLSGSNGPFPADNFSLLTVSSPDVLLWSLKPAEEGIKSGIVARFWNLAESPAETSIALTGGTERAQRTTHIETNLESVTLTAAGEIPAHFQREQLLTFRLFPAAFTSLAPKK